jgi:hypothetical protein
MEHLGRQFLKWIIGMSEELIWPQSGFRVVVAILSIVAACLFNG